MNVADMRRDYTRGHLRRQDLRADPVGQFTRWFKEACDAGIVEPNAMSLATAWPDGRPLVRTVLLKHYDARGFVFYTNFESRKSRQLLENPQAALLFPWLALERQVIVCGPARRLPAREALEYFLSRPRDSQLAAWASRQSSPIASRRVLQREWAALRRRFAGTEIPLPDFWGGFRVAPESVEFWQGGPHRLHDRFLYTRAKDGWTIERLAP